MTYNDRYRQLRETKIKHTQDKMAQQGYMDADDYGSIPLPDGYSFTPNPADGSLLGYACWAENFAAIMETHPIYVDPLEILAGRWSAQLTKWKKPFSRPLLEEPESCPDFKRPLLELELNIRRYGLLLPLGGDSHFAPDYRIGLELGWGGLLEKIRRFRDSNPDKTAKEFYDAHEKAVIAIQKWIERHIPKIESLISVEKRPEILKTLKEMLECNKNIISGAPKTLLEACQWIAWWNAATRIYDRDGAGCNLDLLLLPYYEKDIADGILDDEKTIFIIANLLLCETHYYQLSGRKLDGTDLTNKVSYLVLEAGHKLNISANITVRIHDNIDPEFLRFAVECLFNDRNGWPRFSGDRGLMNYAKNPGIDEQTALDRIAVGCNWMAVPGREYGVSDLVKVNCAKIFMIAFDELVIPDEKQSGEPPTIEKLFANFEKHLTAAIETVAGSIEWFFVHQHYLMPELVLNLMMKNTLEKGLDISQCAEIYSLACDGTGLAVIADSLAAIEQRIVKEKRLTWQELRRQLDEDYPDERIRLMLKSSDRFCQGGTSIGDKWAIRVSETFANIVKAQKFNDPKKFLVPGWFSWSSTIGLGKQVGATPDGRKAYTPVTHGCNPNPGFRTDGSPSAQASGVARIQCGYGNTCPLQIEFDPRLGADEGGVDRVLDLIKTHVDMGGTLININVLDKEKLFAANENPALYPDLVVRVTGFTAYFATLSPQFRQLVIDRFLDGL